MPYTDTWQYKEYQREYQREYMRNRRNEIRKDHVLDAKRKETARLKAAERRIKKHGEVKWTDYKTKAKLRKIEWKIKKDWALKQFMLQCEYCGADPPSPSVNGLDRVDNAAGYHVDNLVPCCTFCNRMKGMLSVEEFNSWATRFSTRWLARKEPLKQWRAPEEGVSDTK